MSTAERAAEARRVAPYLTHHVTHHGHVTLVPPDNTGRVRREDGKKKGKKRVTEPRRLRDDVQEAASTTGSSASMHRLSPAPQSSRSRASSPSVRSTSRRPSPSPTPSQSTTSLHVSAPSPAQRPSMRQTESRSSQLSLAEDIQIPDYPPPSFQEAIAAGSSFTTPLQAPVTAAVPVALAVPQVRQRPRPPISATSSSAASFVTAPSPTATTMGSPCGLAFPSPEPWQHIVHSDDENSPIEIVESAASGWDADRAAGLSLEERANREELRRAGILVGPPSSAPSIRSEPLSRPHSPDQNHAQTVPQVPGISSARSRILAPLNLRSPSPPSSRPSSPLASPLSSTFSFRSSSPLGRRIPAPLNSGSLTARRLLAGKFKASTSSQLSQADRLDDWELLEDSENGSTELPQVEQPLSTGRRKSPRLVPFALPGPSEQSRSAAIEAMQEKQRLRIAPSALAPVSSTFRTTLFQQTAPPESVSSSGSLSSRIDLPTPSESSAQPPPPPRSSSKKRPPPPPPPPRGSKRVTVPNSTTPAFPEEKASRRFSYASLTKPVLDSVEEVSACATEVSGEVAGSVSSSSSGMSSADGKSSDTNSDVTEKMAPATPRTITVPHSAASQGGTLTDLVDSDGYPLDSLRSLGSIRTISTTATARSSYRNSRTPPRLTIPVVAPSSESNSSLYQTASSNSGPMDSDSPIAPITTPPLSPSPTKRHFPGRPLPQPPITRSNLPSGSTSLPNMHADQPLINIHRLSRVHSTMEDLIDFRDDAPVVMPSLGTGMSYLAGSPSSVAESINLSATSIRNADRGGTNISDVTLSNGAASPATEFSEYTDLDLLVSRLESSNQGSGGENYDTLVALAEFIGPGSPAEGERAASPFTEADTVLIGPVEVARRRVTPAGRTKVRLRLLDANVDKCGACLSQFREKQTGALSSCGHACHLRCLVKWISANGRLSYGRRGRGTCPVCRAELILSV